MGSMFPVASLVLAQELTHIELQDLVRTLRLVQLNFSVVLNCDQFVALWLSCKMRQWV